MTQKWDNVQNDPLPPARCVHLLVYRCLSADFPVSLFIRSQDRRGATGAAGYQHTLIRNQAILPVVISVWQSELDPC